MAKRTTIGKLDQRISFEAPTPNVGADGSAGVDFDQIETNPTVWAKVETLPGGAEITEAGSLQPRAIWKVTIRQRDDVRRGWRLNYRNRYLYVWDISDDSIRTDFVEIICREYPPSL